jgi:hypothetical protein
MSFSKKNGVNSSLIKKFFSIHKRRVRYLKSGTIKTEAISYTSSTYNFETETTSEGTTTQWTPTSSYNTWVNGSGAINGTFWGLVSNKTVVGWDLGTDPTPSSQTGPNGGATEPSGSVSTEAASDNFLYTEASSNQNANCFVVRTPPFQFGDLISYVGNNFRLEFFVHAYGSQQHDLFVYISTAATSNHSEATLLETFTHSHSGSNNSGTSRLTKSSDSSTYDFVTYSSSVWSKVQVDLNSYKDDDNTYYIYFVAQNGTGFRADLAIDEIKFCEESVI